MAVEYIQGPMADGLRYGPIGLSPLFSILTIVPLAFRHRAPVAALLISVLSIVLPDLFTAVWVMLFTGSMVVAFLLYTVARRRSARITFACTALPLFAYALQLFDTDVRLHHPEPGWVGDLVFMAVVVSIAAGVGQALRQAERRRERLAAALAELTVAQAQRERMAVLDTRRQVARDLHDVVAHAVSLMLLHAGAARLALDDDPQLAERLLGTVEDSGRQASRDLASMLGALRTGPGDLDVMAGAGLAQVGDLIVAVRRAGLNLDVLEQGTPPPLPRSLDAAAFRIVQEALTNTLKHAGPTAARLRICYDDPIVIDLTDEGPCSNHRRPTPSGYGLVNMRERAALFGGNIVTEQAGAGYRVHAVLPLPQPARLTA